MSMTLRVLISEDREDDALLVADELRQAGYKPRWNRVETPEEMRELLRGETWDLIIADYDLPRFSAMGALAIVKEYGLDIPFLIVSGAMREIDAVAGMRAGVHDYLLKDNLTRLGAVVERELREVEVRRERRAAELMLRRQAQVLDQVHDAVIQMDLNGQILKWNRGAERLLGYAENEAVGRPFHAMYFAEDAALVGEMFDALTEDGRHEREARVRHSSGEQRWIQLSLSLLRDEGGDPYGTVAYSQDISTRKTAELALRSSEELYRSLTEALPQMVWVADRGFDPSTVDFCNRQVRAYTGLTMEDLQAGGWRNTIHPEDYERVRRETERAHAGGHAYEAEYRIRRASDHSWRLHLARATPFYDAKGRLSWLATIIDIEDQAMAHNALRKSEKLAAVGRLASSIAHEINNPLEAITNLIYLLGGTELTAEQRDYLRTAEEELARVSHIASHTLRFHRQSTHPSLVSLAELLDSVLTLYRARLSAADIRVERRYDTERPVLCYSGDLRQVFANIIGNAFDATRQGGKVTLRVRAAHDPHTGSPGVRVTVADTGHGMSKDVLSHVWEPFFTTKGINGTGLGLWVSAEIIAKHQGKMRVRSSDAEGRSGTVFSIFFPEMLEGRLLMPSAAPVEAANASVH